jgi:hypothetical protein
MADGSLGGLGSSIGLTATAKDYSNLYRYNQQAKAQKAKAKDDKLEDIIKLVTVKSSESKLHPLEVESMRIRTGEFVQNVRRMAAEDDIRGIDNEVTNMFADLNNAQNRSGDYWGLEKTVREAAAGNKYVPKNVREAARIMVGSESSADFISALNDNQVKRNNFLDYDDNGRVVTGSFDAYDITKKTKDLIAGNSVTIGRGPETYDAYTKTKFFPRIVGLPMDDAAAADVRKMVDPDGTMVNPILTAKQIPSIILSDEQVAAQYIDQYNLEEKTPEEIEQHFFETMVKPNVKIKEIIQTAKPPSSITVNNQPGTPGDYTFEGGPSTNLNFAYSMADNTKFNFQVDSPYSVSMALDGGLTFRINPSRNFINKATGKQYTSTSTQPIDINNVSVLPYEIKDGVKIVIGNDRVKQIKDAGQKVQYSAFVEGKGQLIGAEKEITNADFYTELTPALRSNISNQAAVKGPKVKTALSKGFVRLDQEVAAANK